MGQKYPDGREIVLNDLLAEYAALQNGLKFDDLRVADTMRFSHYGSKIEDWTPSELACALAVEVGELCNLIKKQRRGDMVDLADMAKESADVAIYLDLLCARLGIDLGAAIVAKFNESSAKIGSNVRLYGNGVNILPDSPNSGDPMVLREVSMYYFDDFERLISEHNELSHRHAFAPSKELAEGLSSYKVRIETLARLRGYQFHFYDTTGEFQAVPEVHEYDANAIGRRRIPPEEDRQGE